MASEKRDDAASVLERYSRRAHEQQLAPLWEFFKDWFRSEPHVNAVPYIWHYDEIKPVLMDAANVISAEEAERRVLSLENPGLKGQRLVTDSLYAGLQLIVPGEIAPSHRHSASALRFIVEGDGAYTAVSGEKAYMQPGDFIVTPSWTWHEHGNESDGPMVWLDVLDIPLIRFFGAGFSEHYSERQYPQRVPPQDSHYRFGANMLPVGYDRKTPASPIFSYPYERAREVLERLRHSTEWDPFHGLKMEYIDPTRGGPAIPTISTFMQLLPANFKTKPYKTTAGTVYSVVEGRGRVRIGTGDAAVEFDYSPRDIWATPSWQPMSIEAEDESLIFSASDQVVQETFGVWREQRL